MIFSDIAGLTGGEILQIYADRAIESLATDSRKAIATSTALFFAITGERNDGHRHISKLYERGFRQFIVESQPVDSLYPEANIIKVKSSVRALQQIAARHRSQFGLPVIGITGSNGKTILKEWLYQLMSQDLRIAKSPGSYNSQTGVPLSVWGINERHQLGIFEAGISKPGEMAELEKIIKPTLGLFANIGTAHDEGFEDQKEKIREKLKLFVSSDVIIYCSDHGAVAAEIEQTYPERKLVGWGLALEAVVQFTKISPSIVRIKWDGRDNDFQLPFSNSASVENVCHCIVTMLLLKYPADIIQERILTLLAVPMRLELKQGINGCQIVDDTYNNDLGGLQIALDFLAGIQTKRSVLILSDILQSGLTAFDLATRIHYLLKQAKVGLLIAVGPVLFEQREVFENSLPTTFFQTTEEFLEQADYSTFRDEVILIKGARVFGLEKIVHRLVRKIHGTVMEIDLGAIVHNLNAIRSRLAEGVKIMAMVKAFAYGSGSEEVANLLQYHKIDYLGVAYADEGVELRKNNITLPIMVMNPFHESFHTIVVHSLEPEIYNIALLEAFAHFLSGRQYKIHLKLDTGMHRLGFDDQDIDAAIRLLIENRNIEVASIFSHLAGADDHNHDEFTNEQAAQFLKLSEKLQSELQISPILHLLNSSGILRFPQYQFGMVRLGIGLYGINPTDQKKPVLLPVATLKTIVSQIKHIKKGETIGYGRKGRAEGAMCLATIAIGYADGFSRAFSGGKGEVCINGFRAPVVGNVCMDMTMVDVTGISVKEGDEVIIFGKELPLVELADRIDTIPYEILTGTSERVKRVFYAESI